MTVSSIHAVFLFVILFFTVAVLTVATYVVCDEVTVWFHPPPNTLFFFFLNVYDSLCV